MINYDIESDLKPHLANDEKLLWAGTPKQGVVFRNNDYFLILVEIIGLSMLLMGGVVVSKAGKQPPFGLSSFIFFIPGILIAGYWIIGRFFTDSWRRSKIKYGITNERIIIISGLFRQKISSLNMDENAVSYMEKADGRGTITFGRSEFKADIMQGVMWIGVKQPYRLELIEDAKKVYDIIIKEQKG